MGRPETDPPVLILAPIGRDGMATAELLGRAGIPTERINDLQDLVSRIGGGAAAVVVAEEALFGRDYAALGEVVANQPAWSDLPFVMLTSHQEAPAIAQWRQRLVTALRNVSLLERPVQTITLISAVQSALRARRRQHEVRELVEAQQRDSLRLEALVKDRTRELATANAALRTQIEERARAEETLRQSQKIEAIGQLTGGIAHDFNNLLMVISGGLEMLERQTDVARRHRLLDGMRQAAQRGAALTRQLLAFSRRSKLNPEPIDLGRHIGGMRELLDRSLRENVVMRYEIEEGLWPVEVDPSELELAILNLAVNARDAMPNGGTLVIRASNRTAEAEDKGDMVCLAFEDSGTGMTKEVKEHIFEPFFTTKEVGKGSGLGLAQVHGFAKQSDGTVLIDSEVGRGTTVTICLPRSLRTPAPDAYDHGDVRVEEDVRKGAGNVLLVEDDNQVAALVSQMLGELGYEVMRAATADAALGALANERRVDVVFSDIMMPGSMNGVELAREISLRRPGLPVVLTSGYAEAIKGADLAVDFRVLHKPYQIDELAAALRAATTAPINT